jgi:sterol desaturase/sphingolipid hydroxylase (fatty acid hydroxylase superfamily)
LSPRLSSFALDLLRLCVWFLLLVVIFGPLEKRWTLRSQKFFRKAFGTDVVYYFLSGLLPKLLLIPPMTIFAAAMHRLVPLAFYDQVAALPDWLRLLAAFVIGDIGSYWGHRWSHEWPFLWRFHAIHHSAEEIDWLVNSRMHPVDMVFTRLCGLVPLYALGLAQPLANRVDLVPLLVTIGGTMWGFFIHANVNWRLGWFEGLISTPAFHHWHHTNDGPEVVDKNYSSMLPWVDRIFGTLYLPKQQWPEKYGINSPTPAGVAAQLIQPLQPRDEAASLR